MVRQGGELSCITGDLPSDIADATHMVVGDQNDVFGAAIADFLIRTHAASDAR